MNLLAIAIIPYSSQIRHKNDPKTAQSKSMV